jgi:hypothetical protein
MLQVEPTLKQQAILKCIWFYLRGTGKEMAARGSSRNNRWLLTRTHSQNPVREAPERERKDEIAFRKHSLTDEAMALLSQFKATIQESTNLARIPICGSLDRELTVDRSFQGYSSDDIEETIGVDDRLLPERLDDVYALRIKGTMRGALLCEGDIVILQKIDNALDGDMVVVSLLHEGVTTIRRIYQNGSVIRLEPINLDSNAIETDHERIEILAKVILVQRNLIS